MCQFPGTSLSLHCPVLAPSLPRDPVDADHAGKWFPKYASHGYARVRNLMTGEVVSLLLLKLQLPVYCPSVLTKQARARGPVLVKPSARQAWPSVTLGDVVDALAGAGGIGRDLPVRGRQMVYRWCVETGRRGDGETGTACVASKPC